MFPAGKVGGIVAMAAVSLLSTALIAGGISFTSPLFVRIGATLVAPLSIGWDLYTGYTPGWKCYAGCALVICGFGFINMTWTRASLTWRPRAALCAPMKGDRGATPSLEQTIND